MEQDAPKSARFNKVMERASDLAGAIGWGVLRAGTSAVGLAPVTDELRNLGGREYGRGLWIFVQKFEEAFRDVVKEYVGDSQRLVVFIDDIDRCLPKNAITVLESLKLFLDKAPCVFVIGADQSVIQYGIGRLYGAQYASRDYLEKIIQVPFRVPRVLSQVPYKLWDQVAGLEGYDPMVKSLAETALGLNLRQWKRFLNAYGVATAIANARGVPLADVQAAVRAFVVLLHMRHPDLYDVCNRNPDRAITFFDCCLRQSRVGLKDELIRINLDDFARFAEELGTIDFVKSCWKTAIYYKSPSGQGLDATRLQEAFSCVPL